MTNAVGIDLGGTHLRAGLVSGDRVLTRSRCRIGPDRSPGAVCGLIATVVASFDTPPQTPVGIGFAAMLNPTTGHVYNAPQFGWRDVDLRDMLSAHVGPRAVGIYNDVNAITYGEATAGAARDASEVVAVFVGTGVGSGIMTRGRIVTGAAGCAAELGHVRVASGTDARPCRCGAKGCLEAYVGGHYLVDRVTAELRNRPDHPSRRGLGSGDSIDLKLIDCAAGDGDTYAIQLWREISQLLGRAVANACTLLNPEVLVLGGGVLDRTPQLFDATVAVVRATTNAPAAKSLNICRAKLGDDAGLIGSAALMIEAQAAHPVAEPLCG